MLKSKIVPCEGTSKKISFEWSPLKIPSTDWKVWTTMYIIINRNHLVQHNKQYHRKVLLSGFHLNGHTLGFHPQT